MSLLKLRNKYHKNICKELLRIRKNSKKGNYPNNADGDSKISVRLAWEITKILTEAPIYGDISGQQAGNIFEQLTKDYLEQSFKLLQHIRPGKWKYSTNIKISEFDQYRDLASIDAFVKKNKALASTLGQDYLISPDIVISRAPISDAEFNRKKVIIHPKDFTARHTPIRASNSIKPIPILHASISCKWTLRSDRGQNTRTEALNLIRNRKGKLPHIVAVTAEPTTTRVASLALGTGDIDCVYHFALYELIEAIKILKDESQLDMLNTLVEGRRLRDISDLPFDLAI
ncbi:MAG: NgoMIV family type II restriction endonuclease [Melioribacteraceae bacterium]|nr:NgoMIV family type II restriction endonuclease [Melioribacteraceae bacterium]MCF8353854.1 NgoMIV family type II restriction endonuclease [Melioribacteraceae bacterium]MCF8393087.1 NgoMIV family type II restriction endonuclease [Melioribacteraceae bacterium]MCF8419206.1 NgoMIV family type II restriction endonuclease [Melioribacteraceae bacterium]